MAFHCTHKLVGSIHTSCRDVVTLVCGACEILKNNSGGVVVYDVPNNNIIIILLVVPLDIG